jgi:hypothetical protein
VQKSSQCSQVVFDGSNAAVLNMLFRSFYNANKADGRMDCIESLNEIVRLTPEKTLLELLEDEFFEMLIKRKLDIADYLKKHTVGQEQIEFFRKNFLEVFSGIEELRKLNPQYARDIIPGGKEYALCLPIQISGTYIDQQDSILAYQAKELIHNRRAEIDLMQKTGLNGGYSVNGITYYKIKEGDTLGGIAAKFHVSVKRLKSFNGLTSDFIRAGKTLKIPNV